MVVRGAAAVARQARTFSARAQFAQPALVNGAVGIAVAPRGRLLVVFGFTVTPGKTVEIDVVTDPTASASSIWRSSTTDEPTSQRVRR
jgi:hypothetical protein